MKSVTTKTINNSIKSVSEKTMKHAATFTLYHGIMNASESITTNIVSPITYPIVNEIDSVVVSYVNEKEKAFRSYYHPSQEFYIFGGSLN